MKILVIGKHGFISTCFQTYMKKFSDIQVDAVSVRNDAWKKMDFHGYDAVFNATGLAHNDARMGTDEQFIALNVTLPIALAKKAKSEGVQEFVNMSSMIVYGNMAPIGSGKKITADTVPVPANIYGKSKLMGEKKILKLNDDNFHVAVVRSPLVYGETAVDNFLLLTDYAIKLLVFPYVENARSMIYSDNLCELIRLIIEHKSCGVFYPQQETYICTSELMREIAEQTNHKIWMTRIFNPLLKIMSKRIMLVRRVFGSLAYDMKISNHFGGAYRVVSYDESVRNIAAAKKRRCKRSNI